MTMPHRFCKGCDYDLSAALSAGEPALRPWFSAVPWLDEAFKQPPPR